MQKRIVASDLRLQWLLAGGLFVIWAAVYFSTVSPSVNFIDSGELITALHEPGIAHPPGYPLYVLMGYVVSHLLPGEVAWRVNAISAFWGAVAVSMLFVLLTEIDRYCTVRRPKAQPAPTPRKGSRGPAVRDAAPTEPSVPVRRISAGHLRLAAYVGIASLLGASSTFWSRTAQAKMYTLHYFFVIFIFFAALRCRRALEMHEGAQSRRWLLVLALAFGLSLTNHLMTSLLVPGVLIILLAGRDWQFRLRSALRRWPITALALLMPLLLYLYLPLRAAASPIMDWGDPQTWGDFYRHISGWQYTTYLFGNLSDNFDRIRGFLAVQWWLLSPLVIVVALAGAYFLGRRSPAILISAAVTAALTFVFALAYGISEIEPYMVPFYIMLLLMLGGGVAVYLSPSETRARPGSVQAPSQILIPASLAAGALFMAAVTAVVQYPRQNHSRDRLAEQFYANVTSTLPLNSLIITDYWDFYAPTYYLQQIRSERPDVTIIDKSLFRYPWYTKQLGLRYPWLVQNSSDALAPFSSTQAAWVNGRPVDNVQLSTYYFDALSSFVDRNYAQHPAFLLVSPPCDAPRAPEGCEANNIAPTYQRQPYGLLTRLVKPSAPDPGLPPEPHYALSGIIDGAVPMDEFAVGNSELYARGYRKLAQLYQTAGQVGPASRMLSEAARIDAALKGR